MKATIFNRISVIKLLGVVLLLEYVFFFYIVKSNKELVGYHLLLIVLTFIIFFAFIPKLYSREIVFLIDEKSFSIEYIKEEFEKGYNEKYFYSDIKSYKIYFPSYKYSCFLLKYKNGKKKEYCFIEKMGTWKIEHYNKEIIKSFHKQIQKYNTTQELNEKIIFEKSFFASKSGLIMVVLLISCWVLLLVLNILKHSNPKHIFQLCFLLLPLLHIVSQRKNAIDFYKETMQENPLG